MFVVFITENKKMVYKILNLCFLLWFSAFSCLLPVTFLPSLGLESSPNPSFFLLWPELCKSRSDLQAVRAVAERILCKVLLLNMCVVPALKVPRAVAW